MAEGLEETLRVRRLGVAGLLALSGVFAANPQAAASLSANALPPAFNVLIAEQREALCERVLAAAADLRPAAEPAGPLVADPSWRPT
jgi:hypothetical protein